MKCEHKNIRYLECEECKQKGQVCPVIICCECGETIENRTPGQDK